MGYNMEKGRILIQDDRRGNYYSKLKRGKLKTKTLSKNTILEE